MAAWFAAAVSGAYGAAGEPDPSFSLDGRVSVASAGPFVARAVAVQPDGRILVAGYSCEPGDSRSGICVSDGDSSFRLARLTNDGGLDPEFGQGGLVTTAVGGGRSQAFDVVLLPDGDIVVGGVARDGNGRDGFALARYDAAGALDPGFGAGGLVVRTVGTGFAAIADLVLQRDGSIVAVGQARDTEERERIAIARYRSDGQPDASFGPFGIVLVGDAAYSYGTGGWVAPDGTIVAAGLAATSADRPESFRFATARVAANGTPAGGSQYAPGTSSSFASALTGLGDGRWLAAGVATDEDGRQVMALLRGRPDGVLDPGWDGDGTALVRIGGGAVAHDVVLQADGKAIAAGQAAVGNDYFFALARLGDDGRLDAAFGANGVATTAWSRFPVARATGLALAPDGKPVLAGIGCVDGTGPQCDGGTAALLVARYLADPPPQPPPAPPPPPPPGRPADTRAPAARLVGPPRRMRRSTFVRPGPLVRVDVDEEADLQAVLTARVRRRTVALAVRRLPVARAGRRLARLRPSRAEVRRLGRRFTATVIVRVRDRAGNEAVVRRRVRVR